MPAERRLSAMHRHLVLTVQFVAAREGDETAVTTTTTTTTTATKTAVPPRDENTARRTHAPGGTPKPMALKEWRNRVLAMHELLPLARQSVDSAVWSYLRSGSDTETTLRRNRLIMDSLALEQSILNDVSQIDPSTTLFGKDISMPVICAPMGNITIFDANHYGPKAVAAGSAGGGVSVARASERSGVGHCLSSLGAPGWSENGAYMNSVSAAGSGLKIFQLYVRGDFDFIVGTCLNLPVNPVC